MQHSQSGLHSPGQRRSEKVGDNLTAFGSRGSGSDSSRPSSRSYVRSLEKRIGELEQELKVVREELCRRKEGDVADNITELAPSTAITNSYRGTNGVSTIDKTEAGAKTLIARVFARRPQLSMDEFGQPRFFGPTSSLHTAESTSTYFVQWGDLATERNQLDEMVPKDLQEHLLDQYWTYQHTVLQVIHKEAFLHDMHSGRCRYFSPALLYAIFACAARISENPQIRALALANEDDEHSRDAPYFLKKATTALEEEFNHSPGITTIQTLQLLSVIYCIRSSDTKGWIESGRVFLSSPNSSPESRPGRAIRLVYELGLHQDASDLKSMHLSEVDDEVRKIVFWGCFIMDRWVPPECPSEC